MPELTQVKAQLSYDLTAECPKCKDQLGLLDDDDFHDDDSALSKPLFTNDWDNARCDVECPHCNHEFEVKGIEY